MRNFTTILAITVGLAFAACDKKPAENSTDEVKPATSVEDEPKTGKFAVKFKISATQSVFENEGAPKPNEVEERMTQGLYATEAFAADGPRKLAGTVTYDIKKLPGDGGTELVLLGGLASPSVKLNAGVNMQTTDEKWKDKPLADMVNGAVDQFVSRIAAQGRVMGGDTPTLAKILASSSESTDAQLMAIQEVRERKLEKLLPQVKPFLAEERDPALRLAACATLVSLGDESNRAEILKVAEDMSRDRDPRMVPLLHILGDLGGQEVVTYLEAVAEGHSAPAVREVAKEALAKANNTAPAAH